MKTETLTENQRKVLAHLKDHPDARYRELAEVIGVKHHGSVQAVLKALVRKGLVKSVKKAPGAWEVCELEG